MWFGKLPLDAKPVTISGSFSGSRLDSVSIKEIHLDESVPRDAFTWILRDGRSAGKGLSIDVTLNPIYLIPGKFNHLLHVKTDLEQTPSITINLSGDLSGSLIASPPRILFGNYELGVPMSESVELVANDNLPFTITGIESNDPELVASFSAGETLNKQMITIQFNPIEDRPRFQTQVRISTDLKNNSEMFLDVHGFQKRPPKKLTPRATY